MNSGSGEYIFIPHMLYLNQEAAHFSHTIRFLPARSRKEPNMNPALYVSFILIVVFLCYFCPALFFSQAAEELQVRSPRRAWIPFVNLILYHDILKYGFGKEAHARTLLVSVITAILLTPVFYNYVSPGGMSEASFVIFSYIGVVAWIVYYVSYWALFYRICRLHFRDSTVLAVLSFIIPVMMPIVMLISYRRVKDHFDGQFPASQPR